MLKSVDPSLDSLVQRQAKKRHLQDAQEDADAPSLVSYVSCVSCAPKQSLLSLTRSEEVCTSRLCTHRASFFLPSPFPPLTITAIDKWLLEDSSKPFMKSVKMKLIFKELVLSFVALLRIPVRKHIKDETCASSFTFYFFLLFSFDCAFLLCLSCAMQKTTQFFPFMSLPSSLCNHWEKEGIQGTFKTFSPRSQEKRRDPLSFYIFSCLCIHEDCLVHFSSVDPYGYSDLLASFSFQTFLFSWWLFFVVSFQIHRTEYSSRTGWAAASDCVLLSQSLEWSPVFHVYHYSSHFGTVSGRQQ